MSPWLFNLFFDSCLKEAQVQGVGLHLGGEWINVLAYADDAVIIAESEQELQMLMDRLNEACIHKELKVNEKKTKVMVFERGDVKTDCIISMNGERLEQVDDFVYLGSLFERNGRIDSEVERRVNAGRRVLGAMKGVVKNQTVSKEAKVAVYKSVVVPTLMYGSEAWTWNKCHKSRLNAVGMDYLRGVCNVTRMDRVRNTVIREECAVKMSVIDQVENGLLRWFGHMERMSNERLTRRIYVGEVEGRRPRGRPKRAWTEQIGLILKERGVKSMNNRRACMKRCMSVEEARNVCQDRSVWRRLVCDVTTPNGIKS